ncbi:MAG: hypothetical protein HeimC3_03940 [Candidatus Heimdallarchaeota archaeon LC_3]|nr:MAG: hypothetical protein HeimC3_03940 [Candidatus Heimdallarchaeota archaeon LC_3]
MTVVSESNKVNEDHSGDVKTYIYVWLGLLVLTTIEIILTFLSLGLIGTILILIFTLVKAVLVAGFFMHLLYEKRKVFLTLTVFILPVLIVVPMVLLIIVLPLFF